MLVALVVAGCSGSEPDPSGIEASTTSPPTTVGSSVASTTSPPTTSPIAWDELPPIDTPAELVAEDYGGRFLAYAAVIDDGDGPILCTPVIALSDPPQCDGVPLNGWDWETVEHDEKGQTRWGQFVVIGRWDGLAFALTAPAFPVDWAKVRTPEADPIDVPCVEPEGGWWADVSNTERLGSADYNAAIDIVNTRPELLSIDIVEPDQVRPPDVQLDREDTGWVPGILVIQLTVIREGDEAAIRELWGGPLCLATGQGPSTGDLNEIERQVIDLRDDIAPGSGILGVGVDDGAVQVGVWVATVEAQARLDEQFGPGVVRLMGLLWAID